MRKLDATQQRILYFIDQAGGSYCPGDDIGPDAVRALHELVKAKRITVEQTDGGARYHLTAQGREDAQ